MKIKIKATNMPLTPLVDDYLRKKIALIEKLISSDDTSADLHVEVGKTSAHHKSGDVFRAEFNLHIAGKDFYVEREAGDLLAAIDEAKDELADTMRSHKNKRMTLIRRGGQKIKELIRGFYRPK